MRGPRKVFARATSAALHAVENGATRTEIDAIATEHNLTAKETKLLFEILATAHRIGRTTTPLDQSSLAREAEGK